MGQHEGDNAPEPNEPENTPEPSPADNAPSDAGTPWSNDLATTFEDEATRSRVDEFLRSTVQPYVTQLEQKSVPNRDAQRLWESFAEDAPGTFQAVAAQLYGEDQAARMIAAINADETDPETPDVQDFETPDLDELPQEMRDALEYVQEKRTNEAWEREFNRVKSKDEFKDIEIDEELFHPFVAAADGDIDTAGELYKNWYDNAKSKFGLNVPDDLEVDDPPPVHNPKRDAAGASTPPQVKEYTSIDEAIDDFFAENKTPPPVV